MKKYIIIILIFGFIIDSWSQISYKKYLDQTVRWTYKLQSNASGYPFYQQSEYSIKGDTSIGNTAYWNVYSRTNTQFNGVPSYWYGPLFGMRETPDKKFYQRNYNDDKEVLMVDFDLEIGDTLFHDYSTAIYVQRIDTILFGNEKRLFFRTFGPYGVVEGIGVIQKGFSEGMVCFQKQNSFYPSGPTGCGFYSETHEMTDQGLYAWPNPADTEVNIELPDEWQKGPVFYKWLTTSGQLMRDGVVDNPGTRITITIDEKPGLYIILVGDGKKWVHLRTMVAH